jgi:hypothetical protein
MPVAPAWAARDEPDIWAPEVIATDGGYVLYFSARHANRRRQDDRTLCVGAAFPAGAGIVAKAACRIARSISIGSTGLATRQHAGSPSRAARSRSSTPALEDHPRPIVTRRRPRR